MMARKKKQEEEEELKQEEREEEKDKKDKEEKKEEEKEEQEEKAGFNMGLALVGLAAFIVMGIAAYLVALKIVAPHLAGEKAVAWEIEPMEQNMALLEGSGKVETKKEDEETPPSKSAPEKIGTIYEIKELIVNLADEDEDRYLKIGIAVELENPKAAQEISSREAIIKDALISMLSSKQSAEISVAEGKEELRKELVEKLNTLLPTKGVKGVYFTDFVIQ